MQPRIAFMYDFDRTLCTRDMQEYGFIPELGMEAADFWRDVSAQSEKDQMDPILSYLYFMVIQAREKNLPLTRAFLREMGRDIELFPGVKDWFQRIRDYGEQNSVIIEHYVISSGLKEIIEGSLIADEFTRIYASEFHYGKDGIADWPAMAVNFTNKTQFLFRIHKGALGISDERINEETPDDQIYVPYTRMVYMGDGMTDVPCMSLVRRYGGTSIAVYSGAHSPAKKLFDEKRVNFIAPADYTEGSPVDTIAKKVIDSIAMDYQLDLIQKREMDIFDEKY